MRTRCSSAPSLVSTFCTFPPLPRPPPQRMQTNGKLMGPARTASLLLKEAGVAGFYRGVFSPMVGTGLVKAAVFGGYGLCQSLVRKATGKGKC